MFNWVLILRIGGHKASRVFPRYAFAFIPAGCSVYDGRQRNISLGRLSFALVMLLKGDSVSLPIQVHGTLADTDLSVIGRLLVESPWCLEEVLCNFEEFFVCP